MMLEELEAVELTIYHNQSVHPSWVVVHCGQKELDQGLNAYFVQQNSS